MTASPQIDFDKSIRSANVQDLDAIVAIHQIAFKNFFLTSLGPRFLKTMYKGYITSPYGVSIVASSAEELQGFAIGHIDGPTSESKVALKNFFEMAISLIGPTLRNPKLILNRFGNHIFKSGTIGKMPTNSVALRSFCVRPDQRGNGLAVKLLKCFEDSARQKNASSIYLTTDANLNERAIAFYKKCGYSEATRFSKLQGREMFLFTKVIQVSK